MVAVGRGGAGYARVVACAALLGLLTLLVEAAHAPWAPHPSASARADYPVALGLDAVTPAVPREGGELTVGGTLANSSDRDVTDAHVGVRIGTAGALGTRGDLAAVAARGELTEADGEEVAGHTARVGALRDRDEARFRLTLPVDELGLEKPGAYALTVTLTDGEGTVRGLARTFLPWYPGDAPEALPLRTTVLWPLTDVPHMQALALGTGERAEPVFRDDALAASLGPGGRLRRLVETGAGRPVTWVVDPDLIAQARAMVDGYRVARTPDTTDPRDTRAGEGGQAADEWLAALREAVRGREVVVLPYADLDLASLAHNDGALPASSWPSVRQGAALVEGELDVRVRGGLGWPVAGALDDRITGLARRLGLPALLTSGEGLTGAPTSPWGATDDTPVALGGSLTALTYDTTLRGLLGRRTGRVPARQRLLAETLTAVEEAPNARRGLVVVPPRELAGTPARALAEALTEGERAGWLEPTRLDAALADPTPAGAAGSPADYPLPLRATELTPRYLRSVARDERRLHTLAKVLSEAEATTGAVRAALARAVSVGWRGDRAGARAYEEGLSGFLVASTESVRLVPKSTVTVAGDSATIPVTVENGLQQAIDGVEVRVTSGRPERLSVDNGSVPVRVPRAASRTVRVEVRAHANGPVRMTARLYTTVDGRPWGDPIGFTADVREVDSGAVIIVLGGLLLIVLAVLFQLGRRRRRRAREQAEGAGETGDGPG
ncbi:hypothetical protein CD790_01180 [Streptomyces sp. SAJ15]|nr:hypothetical protein CD790_01180 [Streptomyces sp. SAJ15]